MHKLAILLTALLLCAPVYAEGFPELAANEQREASQQMIPSTLRQDCALVTHFMTQNGGYVLAYENAQQIRKNSDYVLANTTNLSARGQAAYDARDAQVIIDRVKPKMVHIHVSPEDWTVEDLQKLKDDPKSKEVFKALVRVRDGIYDPEVPADVRKQLAQNLLGAMTAGTAASELRGLLDRVQKVGGGKPVSI